MSAVKIVQAIANEARIESFHGNGERYWCVPVADMPEGDVDEALHAAAEALEALAVPGVAELLTMLAQDGACVTAGIGGEYPDDAQRAALTTLVKIGGDR